MKEITGLAEIKINYAKRIKAAITAIRRQVLSCDQKLFDEFFSLVTPSCADNAIGATRLNWIPDLHRDRVRNESKLHAIVHEVGKAILEYYTLIRTDDEVGLERMVQRLENYAQYGFKGCELLGGPDVGYGLFDPRQQQ